VNTFTKAQLTVADGISPNALIRNVLLGDPSIEVKNISYSGYDRSVALFENGNTSSLGLDKGIILSSGLAVGAKGPNNSEKFTSGQGAPGSTLLNGYITGKTLDAATLQFDFKPLTSEVVFTYVFSSEEYTEFVDKGFDDIFGFFVQGPGILGEQNVALVPGTNIPVSIDNISNITNSKYFIQNIYPNTPMNNFLQHDGQTVVLEAHLQLIPCEWYTIKLAIADVQDNMFDSWVFIGAQSFKHKTDLGNDTFFCEENFTKTLYAGNEDKRVYWSTGDTSHKITVDKFGDYWVEVFTKCGSFKDYITIAPAISSISLGKDTAYCGIINNHNLEVTDKGYERYLWSTGDTTRSLMVDKPGKYWLKVSKYGCQRYDTINLTTKPIPMFSIANDTFLCQGDKAYFYSTPNADSYLWSTGSVTPDLTVDSPGTYRLVTAKDGCLFEDSVHVFYRYPFEFDLGPAMLVKCRREPALLDTRIIDVENYNFNWSSGEKSSYIFKETGGTYSIVVTDKHCNYSWQDAINLVQYEGGFSFFVPNSFTPNDDKLNDIFGPVHSLTSINSFKMAVFNRWGEKVFESTDPNIYWDGKIEGIPAPNGVYIWYVDIRSNCLPDDEQFQQGSVHLMR
jgi:gliding motility-associated-like protein